jgi:hypothetical protein
MQSSYSGRNNSSDATGGSGRSNRNMRSSREVVVVPAVAAAMVAGLEAANVVALTPAVTLPTAVRAQALVSASAGKGEEDGDFRFGDTRTRVAEDTDPRGNVTNYADTRVSNGSCIVPCKGSMVYPYSWQSNCASTNAFSNL